MASYQNQQQPQQGGYYYAQQPQQQQQPYQQPQQTYGYGYQQPQHVQAQPVSYGYQQQQPASPGYQAYNDSNSSGYNKPLIREGAPLGQDAAFVNSGLKEQDFIQGEPLYDDAPNSEATRRFVKTGYRDVWAAILFILAVVVSIGFACYNGKAIANGNDGSFELSDEGRDTLRKFKTWLPVGLGASFLFGSLILAAMRAFTRQFIIGSNILLIVLNIAIAIYAFSQQVIFMAVIWLLLAVLQAVWLYLVRRRIPLATVLLNTSVGLITRFYGTIAISVLALGAGAVYFIAWIFMSAPVSNRLANSQNEKVEAWVVVAALGCCLALLWVSQVCTNVAHVTASGVVATWYFCGETLIPQSPTGASAKRAMTTSFGSICFGSLVVAVVKLIYYMVRAAANNSRNEIAACIAVCIMGCIERLLEYFNVYAFTHVAIYGTSYIQAAKQTWELVKQCGWAAYFNDSLIWPVLSLVTFFPSLALGVACGLAAQDVVVGVVVFFICYIVLMLLLRPVYSGVVTQFVCVAEAPDVMQAVNPSYYAAIEEATSHLQQSAC